MTDGEPGGVGVERRTTRRALLGAAGAATASLAGCAGVTNLPDGGRTGRAATSTGAGTPTPTAGDSAFPADVRERAHETGLRVRKSVVVVGTPGRGGPGGTGWVLDDSHVVTNSHVVKEDTGYEVETFDGATIDAERVGFHSDLEPDVALLEADVADVPALDTGSSTDLQKGDPLLQVGHPASVGNWVMSLGRFVRRVQGLNWLLSTVPTAQGNSGSPLMTLDGRVVGVTSGGTSAGEATDYSRATTVFEEFPKRETYASSVQVETLLSSVESWT